LRVATPGHGAQYIIRESSSYSLALDDGLGFSLKKIVKKIKKVAWKGIKQYGAFTANLFTLGAANKFTSVSKWSGAKTAGKLGTVAGITMAAVAGGAILATAGGAPAAAGATSATGATGATSAAASTTSWIASAGVGAKTVAGIAGPAMTLLKLAGGTPKPAPAGVTQIMPEYAGGGGSWDSYSGGAYAPGGGGGGVFDPGGEGLQATAPWLPLVLIGAIGVVLITQRR
jgi:hypothetical protein